MPTGGRAHGRYSSPFAGDSRDEARRLPDRDAEAREAGEDIAAWILTGNGPKMDVAAADEIKHLGLIANYDR